MTREAKPSTRRLAAPFMMENVGPARLTSDVKPLKLDVGGWCRSLASGDGVVFGPISQIRLEVKNVSPSANSSDSRAG